MTDFEREHLGFVMWRWKLEDEPDWEGAATFEDWQELLIESEREQYRRRAEALSNRLLNNLAIIGVGLERCGHCAWDRREPV